MTQEFLRREPREIAAPLHVRQAWRVVPLGTGNREAKADREVTWG